MKFCEFVQAVVPVVPGGLTRAPYLRNLISMFTTVPESDWATNRDPSVLPSDATLDAMYSRDRDCTKKYANAFYSRLDLEAFIDRLSELDLATQQQIVDNFASFGVDISTERMPEAVAGQLIDILRGKAKITDDPARLLREAQIAAAKKRFERQILLRQRGCTNCGRTLVIESHGATKESLRLVFIGEDPSRCLSSDLCALCPACSDQFTLNHTPDDLNKLRDRVRAQVLETQLEEELAPLGLDPTIRALLAKINDLDIDTITTISNYDIVPLKNKLSDAALIRQCRDHMAIYESTIRAQAQSLEDSGELDFEKMTNQIKTAWLQLRDQGLSQSDLVERLTDWVHDQTQVNRYASAVVVSFLIQICELFSPSKVAGA